MLRLLLGDVLGVAPESLRFERGDKGKPFLPDQPQFHFNLSHSEGYAALAWSAGRTELGLDLEDTTRNVDWAALAPRFFARPESERLSLQADPRAWFFRTWTAKEAYIKAIGTGLFLALDQFITYLEPQGWGLYDLEGGPLPWQLQHLESPFPDVVAAWVGATGAPPSQSHLYSEGSWHALPAGSGP